MMIDFTIILMELDLFLQWPRKRLTKEQIKAALDAHETLLIHGYSLMPVRPPCQIGDLTAQEAWLLLKFAG